MEKMKYPVKDFNWGGSNDWYRETIFKEIFMMKIYEKYFEVNEGDIVFDAGASIGPFSFSIKDQNPKHIYCVEPSLSQIEVLEDNLSTIPHTTIPHGIGKEDILVDDYGLSVNKSENTIKEWSKLGYIVRFNNNYQLSAKSPEIISNKIPDDVVSEGFTVENEDAPF